jgi:hypothetical protein
MNAPNVLPFPGKLPLFVPENVSVSKERLESDFVALQLALGILQKDVPKLEEFCSAVDESDSDGIEQLVRWLEESADHLAAGSELMKSARAPVLLVAKRRSADGIILAPGWRCWPGAFTFH